MLEILGVMALALLFGGMAAFSFLFAPLVFAKLPGEVAARFIRAVFPWYYLFVLGVAALAAGLLARQVLMPAINRLRDRQLAGEAAAGRWFARLHQGSVLINLAQMAAAGWALAAVAG